MLLGARSAGPEVAVAERIEARRRQLLRRTETYRYRYDAKAPGIVRWPDEGPGATGEKVSLRWLASAGSVPPRWGRFLHACAGSARARTVLELGASTGISSAYLASAECIERFATIEASAPLAAVASETLLSVGAPGTVVRGSFAERLPDVLDELCDRGRALDLAFVDGHHDEDATLAYFDTIRPRLRRGSIVVFDDIRLWSGMWRAWNALRTTPRAAAAVDTGRFGILVQGTHPAERPRSYDLSRYTGRWRIGPGRPAAPAA